MAFAEQVELLLSQATREHMYYTLGSNSHVDPDAYFGKHGPNTHIATAGHVHMNSEPAMLLERLYAGADPVDRQSLGPTLVRLLDLRTARVIARTLAATGQLETLHGLPISDAVEELWRGLIHVMRFESPLFGEDELRLIEDAAIRAASATIEEGIKQIRDDAGRSGRYRLVVTSIDQNRKPVTHVEGPMHRVRDEVRDVISRIRYLRLAKTIREGRNPAVDVDRQVLISRLQSLGFSSALVEASHDIERRAATAVNDTDVKTVMDLLRTFFEEFTEEACRKLEPKVGKLVPAGAKLAHYSPYRQYLENAGLIDPDESELLQKLYNFMSNKGAHKLGSAPELLRVAQVTVVEWCMLLAGRIEHFVQ